MVVGAIGGYVAQVANNMSTGMSFGDALVTDISGTKILQGAAIAGIGVTAAVTGGVALGISAGTITTIGQRACEDGNCTNEISAAGNAVDKAAKLAENVIKGQQGQTLSGWQQNYTHIDSFTETAKYRIPDMLDKDLNLLGEVKNVQYLRFTNQLRDYLAYAENMDFTFYLQLPQSARIAAKLQTLINAGRIIRLPLNLQMPQ
jgi:hypothetical protein